MSDAAFRGIGTVGVLLLVIGILALLSGLSIDGTSVIALIALGAVCGAIGSSLWWQKWWRPS